jgi:hypothetical protein
MSSADCLLNPAAIKLLFDCLESPVMLMSGAVLQRYPAEATLLKQSQLIKPSGHEQVGTMVADDSDMPVSLTWSSEDGGYGYFDDVAGWVRVSEDELVVWTVDVGALISVMTRKLQLPSKPPTTILNDLLWDLGAGRLGHRPKRTPLMFARRLSDPATWEAIQTSIRDRPSPERRLILTSTKSGRLPNAPSGCTIVSMMDLISSEGSLALDGSVLALRMHHMPAAPKKPLEVIADGKEVLFFGTIHKFRRGVRQREIICLLHERYLQGDEWVSSEEIIEKLELGSKARIRDYFKSNKAWNSLLTERDGMCGFCFDLHREA